MEERRRENAYLQFVASKEIQFINLIKSLKFSNNEKVSIGSIVEIEDENSEVLNYFISPGSGGSSIKNVQIVSINSPIGNELIGLEEGDSFELELPSGNKEFSVIGIK